MRDGIRVGIIGLYTLSCQAKLHQSALMSLAQGSDENGTFSVTSHAYTETNSLLTYFDYITTPSVKVGNFINLIYQLHRDKYRMTGSGNGCRFWMYVIDLNAIDMQI